MTKRLFDILFCVRALGLDRKTPVLRGSNEPEQWTYSEEYFYCSVSRCSLFVGFVWTQPLYQHLGECVTPVEGVIPIFSDP